MATIEECEARILSLEEAASHQEQHIRELSATVFELRTALDRLESFFRRQQERLESLSAASGAGDAPAHDPPPHY
ncbi:MAG: SlyX family protein [Candidatus Eisenbacteria bacterium]|uniref:SlyX family protein n=1 Tax=Eiseniibacteriota bacterium TaxID=2212470 RepID=A0A956LZM5_UNCEI|nr:SlyX family protein [Candidatus Eisenbacteria bacterium]